ncbi:unnamed protein product [Closterium sp. NIES-54]
MALCARPSLRGAPPPPLLPPTPLLLLLTSLVQWTSGPLLLVRSAVTARARVEGVVAVVAGVVVGAAVEVVGAVEVVAVVGAVGVAVVAVVGVVAAGLELCVEVLEEARGSSNSVGARPRRPSSFVSGLLSVGHLGVVLAARMSFARAELLRSGVAIFDLDFDAILAAMYALSTSAEGDCYLCVPPDPGIEVAALGASESVLPSTAPAEALPPSHLTQVPHAVSFATAPPSLLSLHLYRSGWLTPPGAQFSPNPPLCSRVRRSGSTPLLMSPPVTPDPSVAPPPGSPFPATPSWHALPPPFLWSSQVSASPLTLACPALPSLRRGAAARRSSLLLVSPDDCSPADSPHGLRLQLCERFHTDLPVLRLHSYRGGEFSSDLLRDFCRGEGILQSFTLSDSPLQNGIAECRIGLVMEVACTSMIHAAAPHFL